MTAFEPGIRIRNKAHELFMQFGLRSVSMDDIANSLGMSKKTIYQYYADKDELAIEVITEEIRRIQSICDTDRVQANNAVHEVFLAMKMVVDNFGAMNPAMLFDMEKFHPKAYQKFQDYKNDYLLTVFRENLLRGIREELYRPEIRPDVLALYRMETLMFPFHFDFQHKLKSNVVVLAEELMLHYLYGLATLKGHRLIQKYQQDRKKLINDPTK